MLKKRVFQRALESSFQDVVRERARLVPLLQQVQAKYGYLPRDELLAIARRLRIPEGAVYAVATFYNYFRLTPLGKHPIKVCMGTACHMQGGALVLETLERELAIKVGGSTEDGKFSLERVACIGCCVMAPVVVIGETIHPRMTPSKVEEVLIPLRHQT